MIERFYIKHERTIIDDDNGVGFVFSYPSDAEKVCRLLNTLSDENEQLKSRIEYLERKIERERNSNATQERKWQTEAENQINELSEENEQLKILLDNISAQRDEFHRGARENANRVGELEKENEQLKKENKKLHETMYRTRYDVYDMRSRTYPTNRKNNYNRE